MYLQRLPTDIEMRSFEQKLIDWKAMKELAEDSPIVADALDLTDSRGISREQALMVAVIRLAQKNEELAGLLQTTSTSFMAPTLRGDAASSGFASRPNVPQPPVDIGALVEYLFSGD